MNSISQYEEMKDSGIKWIGKVPAKWNIRRLYQIVTRVNNKNTELAEQNLLSLSYGKIKRKDINTKDGLLPASFDGYNIIEGGDIVLRLTDLQNDHTSLRVGHATEKGIITSAYTTIRPINPAHSDYLYYLIHAFDLKKGFYGMGSGVRQGLNYDEVKELHIVIPSQDEQNAIVSYLDDQCAQIDSLVQEAKETIEEYKKWRAAIIFEAVTKGLDKSVAMRDSGVDWIGEVPTHWDLPKIKHITSKVGSGKTPRGGAEVYVNEGVLFLRSQNIYDEGLKLDNPYYITNDMDEEMCNTRVYANDVLLNITGGSIGRCCVYPNDIGNANVNQHVSIIRVNSSTITPEYMHLFWISPLGKNAINIYQTGGNREGMSAEAIKETPIPLPPLDEQIKTVNHIKPFINSIEEIINDKESLITDLESYKKSLIYETVTGKRKVVQS